MNLRDIVPTVVFVVGQPPRASRPSTRIVLPGLPKDYMRYTVNHFP